MDKKDLFGRIDYLINRLYSSTGEDVIFEIDELLNSLLGKEHFIYQNYLNCYHIPNTSSAQKRVYMGGVLNGLKNHIEFSSTKKYQVFVSSTYQDLICFRQAVSDAISFANHIPAGMENFKASSNNPTEYIKRVIDLSDYYILLIGQRYGSIQNPSTKTSFTKMEYEYARQKGMVILPFIYSGETPLENNDLDKNETLLNIFIDEIKSDFVVSYFQNSEQLKTLAIQALQDAIVSSPQKGWIRL